MRMPLADASPGALEQALAAVELLAAVESLVASSRERKVVA